MNGGALKGQIKVSGLKETRVSLRNIAIKVPDHAARTMRQAAANIVDIAKQMVPRDEGNLEESIRAELTKGVRGRLQVDIVAGGNQQVIGRYGLVTLDQYAWIIHERYDELEQSGALEPGDGTKRKRLGARYRVGGFFLTRALEEEAPRLNKKMIAMIGDVIREYMT